VLNNMLNLLEHDFGAAVNAVKVNGGAAAFVQKSAIVEPNPRSLSFIHGAEPGPCLQAGL
jgi:hypothetical protein